MSAGLFQLTTELALVTVNGTSALDPFQFAPSSGVNVTDSTWSPAFRTVPADGEYVNVPVVDAVAFSCVGPSGVPYTMLSGRYHVTCAVAFDTAIGRLIERVSRFTVSAGVNVAVNVCEPAVRTV